MSVKVSSSSVQYNTEDDETNNNNDVTCIYAKTSTTNIKYYQLKYEGNIRYAGTPRWVYFRLRSHRQTSR